MNQLQKLNELEKRVAVLEDKVAAVTTTRNTKIDTKKIFDELNRVEITLDGKVLARQPIL